MRAVTSSEPGRTSKPARGASLNRAARREATQQKLVTPLCLSVEESAAAIGIGRTRMWDLVRSGRIPAVRINHRVLIRMDDLERFIDSLAPIEPKVP